MRSGAARRGSATFVVAMLVLAVAFTMLGCSTPDDRHPAVIAMEEVLELRRDTGASAEDYAPYFQESSVATALAESTEGTVPPVPLWEEPYLSAETSATADVVVVWKADEDHPDWPAATIFVFELLDDEWRITDAQDAGDEVPEPLETVGE